MKALNALFSLLITFMCPAMAQKLPNKQEGGVWASINNITKKENKWNLPYQAYNSATEVFYTVANDDKNLYLVVKGEKPYIAAKMVYYKVTFQAKSNDVDLLVKFPVLDRVTRLAITDRVRARALKDITDADILKAKKDSIAKVLNKQFLPQAKQFIVNYGKVFKDSTMSIYNEAGILISHHVESDLAYVYELTIPLKYLGIKPAEKDKHIAYTILLNGSEEDGVITTLSADGKAIIRNSPDGKMGLVLTATPEDIASSFPTKVSGEYKLAVGK